MPKLFVAGCFFYVRELSFNKGDFISVIRHVDANWVEAELNGKVGFVPSSYIEVLRVHLL